MALIFLISKMLEIEFTAFIMEFEGKPSRFYEKSRLLEGLQDFEGKLFLFFRLHMTHIQN